ncbi:capsular exopolysaccharide synthesis family protein [Erythromicrobium ramosum]|uniref:non-specific protein-tyrosine kinase n=1 Tax=Erythrobacter ramosus TaxID=35811 RepID=A0A6I4UQZ6_9SPHN|nr:polysaccharide biosynthesis tyrosine autokinase [Erythrobacter ramosus]MBB3777191.1 capsular exopolysaccharide synthesis family protein [Erythrobacter ramosus]MXP39973.1 polysaccharide biosynthesis tyrosine autokinase [Erythrobacter ramosus]
MNEISFDPDEGPHVLAEQRARQGSLAVQAPLPLVEDDFEDDGLDLRAIMRVLLARWYWILAAGLLGLLAALAYSLTVTPLYRTSVTLELNPPTVPIIAAGEAGQTASLMGNDYEFLPTQYGLMKSRDLAKRVVEDLNLASTPASGERAGELAKRIEGLAAQLSGGLEVGPVPDSRLVTLSYTADNPQEAARIANGFADAYVQSSIDRRYESTAKTRDFLSEQLKTTREKLNQSEQALVGYARANNIIMPGGESEDGTAAASLTSTSLTTLNSALAEAQQRRIAAEQRYRQAGALTENQSATASLRAEKATLEAEYREKSTYLGDEYPDMVRLREKIRALNDAIGRESRTASGGLAAEFRAAQAEESALRARVQQLSGSVLAEQDLSSEYRVLQREVDTQQSLYQALLEQYNQIGVGDGVGAPAGVIVDRAQVPGGPYTPNVPRNLILGLLLGLALGVGAAMLYEFLTDLIKTAEDVREKLLQPPLGTIPKLKRGESLTDELADPKSPMSEAYGSLLTTLQFSTSQGMPAILTVTSATASEGKSTTSLVLAKRLTAIGKRVLLIDADMRRPSFIFDNDTNAGLSQLLTKHGALKDNLIRTNSGELYLLPSGPVPPNPSLLLNSKEMRTLIARLRNLFDHIIIDSPPTLGFADSIVLGSLSDGVLLAVESGRSRRRVVLEAIAQLHAAGGRIVGVALTKCPKSAVAYGYDYGYYDSKLELNDEARGHELSPQLFGGPGPEQD